MDQIPKIVRQRLQATAKPGVHPDPNLLTAFAEKSLGERERVQVLEHLAQCGECREAVGLATPEFEPEQIAAASPARSEWLRAPVLRWGALAACAIVVGAAVTLPRLQRKTQPASIASSPASKEVATQNLEAQVSESTGNVQSLARAKSDTKTDSASTRTSQLDQSPVANGRFAAPSATKRSSDERAAPVSSQVAQALPAAPLPARAEPELRKENDKKEGDRDKAVQGLAAQSASEVVEVETKSVALDKLEVSQEKVKESPNKLQDSAGRSATGGTAALANRTAAEVTPSDRGFILAGAKLTPRWTLSSQGTLQRSLDAGKTWETIPVADKPNFRALASVGPDVWVAGSGGALYHSSDGGAHWLQVKPVADGQVLSADIIRVEFTDAQHGKLTTADGKSWTTSDGGQTWQKN